MKKLVEKINKKRIIFLFIIIIFLLILLFSMMTSKNYSTMEISFPSRIEKLNGYDTHGIPKYGWLQVQGTLIDVPIISSLIEGDVSFDYGWISNSSIGYKTRKVLVGHNILNVSSNPMVNNNLFSGFEDLMAFVYYDFAKENMYLSFTENGVDKIYVIYAIGFYDYDYDNAQGLSSDVEISNYIKEVKKNSIYNYDVNVNKDDNLLTVKTCTRYFGLYEKQQFVIDARELRENEIPLKYVVSKTKLYKEYKLNDHYSKSNVL